MFACCLFRINRRETVKPKILLRSQELSILPLPRVAVSVHSGSEHFGCLQFPTISGSASYLIFTFSVTASPQGTPLRRFPVMWRVLGRFVRYRAIPCDAVLAVGGVEGVEGGRWEAGG